MSGPLAGVKVVELAGIGPAPFAGMMLADMGADVIRVDRPPARRADAIEGLPASPVGATVPTDVTGRGRRSIAMDLKHPAGRAAALELVAAAEVLIEGFRPGVAERLGLDPAACLEVNPRLVYGRMTGWGQDGPYATSAGHDINYIALSGALSLFGRREGPPVPPVNLVGDFGGGGMLLAFGVVAALLETSRSGRGQVVDAAMVDGAALLSSMIWGLRAAGVWGDARGTNLLDTGAWYYDVYETADHRWISIGALEPRFFAEMVRLTGVSDDGGGPLPDPGDREAWPAGRRRLAAVIATKTRDEWCDLLEGTDACFAPVLGLGEAPEHVHNQARRTFVVVGGVLQPAPAPRFSRTPGAVRGPAPAAGADTEAALADWGLDAERIETLREVGAI